MGFDFGGSAGSQSGGAAPKPPKSPKPPKALRGSSFVNRPTLGSGSSYRPGMSSNGDLQAPHQVSAPRTPRMPRGSFSLPDIPWDIVFGVIAGLAIVAFLWVNRAAISAFLAEVFTWVFVILICVFILRYIIFGRFTRR